MSSGALLVIGFLFLCWCGTYLCYKKIKAELKQSWENNLSYRFELERSLTENDVLRNEFRWKQKQLSDLENALLKMPKKKRDFIKHELKRTT